MSTQVYVVTTGRYSDYSIDAIFLDKNEADKYQAEMEIVCGDTNPIEIWTIGRPHNKKVKQCWHSTINIVTGKVDRNWLNETDNFEWVDENARTDKGDYFESLPYSNGFCPDTITAKSYVSQDHADKLAIEGRQAILRRFSERGLPLPKEPVAPLISEEQGKPWYR